MKRVVLGAIAATAGLALAALGVGVTVSEPDIPASGQLTQADSTWGFAAPTSTPTPAPEITLADSTWG